MLDTRLDLQHPVLNASWDYLSRAYAERVDQLNELRERLDRIGEVLVPYLEFPEPAFVSADDLKRVLDLAAYSAPVRARS